MIQTTEEILKEAMTELDDTIEYVLSESGDLNIPTWLQEIQVKLAVVYGRLTEGKKQKNE